MLVSHKQYCKEFIIFIDATKTVYTFRERSNIQVFRFCELALRFTQSIAGLSTSNHLNLLN